MRLRSGGAYAAELPQTALPHDVLVRIFGLLPRSVLAVTPGRVCRAWAAAKRDALAARLAVVAALEAQARTKGKTFKDPEREHPYLPRWYVRGVVGDASDGAKRTMMAGACYHGLVDVVEELCAASPPERFGATPCRMAAHGGQLDVLVFLRKRGFLWDDLLCALEAAGGHLDMEHLFEHGCPGACVQAASRGHLRILEYLHAQGALLTDRVLWHAAYCGRLEIVTWFCQRGCPWNESTLDAAAWGGHLPMVQLLRAQGCEWGQGACRRAACGGHLEVLQHLVAQGCPIDVKQCIKAAEDHPACREWLKTLLPPPAAAH
jgi:hypothetical protein